MTRQISLVSTLSSCFDKLIKFDIYGFKLVSPRHLVLVKCLLAGWRAQWRAKLCSFGLFLFTGSALWDLEQKIRCQTFLWTNNQWFQQQQNMTNHNHKLCGKRVYSHILPQNFSTWSQFVISVILILILHSKNTDPLQKHKIFPQKAISRKKLFSLLVLEFCILEFVRFSSHSCF